MRWSVYVCVCLCTCAVKAYSFLKRMRSWSFVSTREHSCALQGAGERTWKSLAYLCFYEPLKIRLAWGNLPQPRPLSPQMQEMGREEGVIEKPPVQNVWSMASCTSLYHFRARWAVIPQLHLRLIQKDTVVFKGLNLPHLVYSPLQKKAMALASALLFYRAKHVFTKQHKQLCF